jgi:hypothetical protein
VKAAKTLVLMASVRMLQPLLLETLLLLLLLDQEVR